ncbi:MAG: type II CAAX endopeptidase family protein [Anaerolineales bacterium]|nr:MAG: type II CAAX endopeptidase family protein [Anaerolineales bacterium]
MVVTFILLLHITLMFVERTIALVVLWLCIIFLLQKTGRRTIGLRAPAHWGWWLAAPVVGLLMVGLTAAALWLLFGWTEQNLFYDMAHAVGWSFNLLGSESPLWARWALLAFAWLSSPFLEEPLFRGFAQSIYRQKVGLVWAILLQSGLFALVHPFTSLSWPLSIFATGVVYGLLAKYSRSIWPAALAHIAYNLGIVWISFRFMPQFVFQAW